ncbi:hypothetical protein ACRQGC_08745, partial [Actinotignum sp. GS-2025c]
MLLKREFAIYSYVTILNDLAGVARYLLCFGDAQAHLFHKIHLSGDMRTRKSSDYLPMEKRCLTTRGRLIRHPAFSLRLARERGGGTLRKKLWAGITAAALSLSLAPTFSAPSAHAYELERSDGVLGEIQSSVYGRVFFDRGGNVAVFDGNDEGLAGVKVYAQWVDFKNKKLKGAVSPVYWTETKADGKYSIKLPKWTDALGIEHEWKAQVGQGLRIWSDNPDKAKYVNSFVESDGVFVTNGMTQRYVGTWNAMPQSAAENFNISYQERPQISEMFPAEDTWKESKNRQGGGYVKGRVFYDQRNLFGAPAAVRMFQDSLGDIAVPNVKVVGTYVQDEVANRFDEWKKNNNGYTRDRFKAAQREIMAKYEQETGKSAFAETVYAMTDAQGRYHIQFQGLWGDTYYRKGIVNAGKHGDPVPEGQGWWAKGNMSSRHINVEYMYVAPVLPEGVGGALDNFPDNLYQYGAEVADYATDAAQSNIIDQDFALRMEDRDFQVLEYNQTTKPAAPGVTVQTEATGFVPSSSHEIVWTDSEGNEVHKCISTSSNLGVVDSCPLTVPADLDHDEIYTATIYPEGSRDTALAKDAFAAKPTPEYKHTLVDLDTTETVASPLHKENGTKPRGASYAPLDDNAKIPAELLADVDQNKVKVGLQPWATVNEDGTISLAPKKGEAEPGEYLIPVKMTTPTGEKILLAPITVRDPNADGDNDGTPDLKDQCPAVAGPASNNGCPAWGDGDGKPGADVTLAKDPANGPIPDTASCEASNGATCSFDGDGNVVVKVPGDAKDKDE